MASVVDYPLVSIIVPMYNVGKFALPCVRSLLSQTYPNIEILIVDDGCTDNTIDLIEDTIGDDPRVVIHHKENGGLSSARNYGTQRCRGNYLMYVDGDDLIDPRTIELMVEAALKYQVTLVAGSFAKTPLLENYEIEQAAEFKVESGAERFRKLLLFNGESGSACGKLFARSLIPYLAFPEGQLFEDMGVIASVCSRVGEIAFSDAPFYAYVTRPGSITTFKKQGPKHAQDMDETIETVRLIAGGGFKDEFECFRACDRSEEGELAYDAIMSPVYRIAEDALHLSEEVQSAFPEYPWNDIRGFRNFVAHGYREVDRSLAWKVIVDDIPELEKALRIFKERQG